MHKMKEDMNADPYRHISIALVLTWVNKTWKEIRPRTISACFSHCGMQKQFHNSGVAPNNVEEQMNADEQALQELEANDVFQPVADNENLMKEAMKRLE